MRLSAFFWKSAEGGTVRLNGGKDMKEIKDWGSIPFGYTPLRSRYEAVYKDGRWIENGLVGDAK